MKVSLITALIGACLCVDYGNSWPYCPPCVNDGPVGYGGNGYDPIPGGSGHFYGDDQFPGGDDFPFPGGDGHHFPDGGDHTSSGGGSHFPPGGSHFPPGGSHFPPGGSHFPPGGPHFPPGGGGTHDHDDDDDDDDDDYECPAEYKRRYSDATDPSQCLQETLEAVSGLKTAAIRLMCQSYDATDDDKYKIFKKTVQRVVNCTSCAADNLLETDGTLSRTLNPVGVSASNLLEDLAKILKLEQLLGELTCNLIDGLTSECSDKITNRLRVFTTEAETLLCKTDEFNPQEMVEYFGTMGCAVDSILFQKHKLAEGALEEIAKLVLPFLKDIFQDTGLGGIVASLSCPLANVVNNLLGGAPLSEITSSLTGNNGLLGSFGLGA